MVERHRHLWSATLRPKRADLKQVVQKSSLCSSMYVSVSSQIDASVALHNPTTTHLREYPAVVENRKNGNPKVKSSSNLVVSSSNLFVGEIWNKH
ncbi:hypothetical protein DVH24_035651 [Malus domestica]|uniref:Uncharacterized protein n=1 Tax=Malus domestica TaxID=3750 RepID=A0A498JSU7_MALDO|nr:hypothetical protein DVH24_035651 [Malus domestica]